MDETQAEVRADSQDIVGQLQKSNGPVLITGAPGTGKTNMLVDTAVARLEAGLDPQSLLIIAPTRLTAASIRDDLSRRAERTFTEPVVRTWSAYAFDLIRRARVEGLLPFLERSPRLLSGPEQDTLIGNLLEGHASGLTIGPQWPCELELAIETRGFRKEIREFFDRVSELGLEPADIEELGEQAAKPEWVAAAHFYQEYRDLLDLGSAEAFDPAGLITRAAELLEEHPEFLHAEQDRLDLVMVDDLQEATLSQHRLLALLTKDRSLIAFAAPDSVVQGFRGARADQLHRFGQNYAHASEPTFLELTHGYRMPGQITEAWQRIVRRVPLAAGLRGRKIESRNAGNDESCQALTFENSTLEERFIAQRIVHLSLFKNRSLSEMAIVVRNGSQVRSYSRFLEGQGIAVQVPPAEIPLKDEGAVRPLLDLLELAFNDSVAEDPLLMQNLLLSRYGMSTALEIRRLRQLLRQQEAAQGGRRSSQELLETCLREPELAQDLGKPAFGLQRLLKMYGALKTELASGTATPETALWAMWEASGRAQAWREEALGAGTSARRADHDLDAVLSLFQAAERFVDQLPGASVSQFIEHILNQELPMDSLATRAAGGHMVTVLTTAAAAGKEWPIVFIPGLQEGSWPNLRLRGELLGSNALADVVEHGISFLATRTPTHLVRQIRNDELRSFSNAVSRASEQLICTAVDNEDQQPSSFLDLVEPPSTEGRTTTSVPRIRSLPTLVAQLRKTAELSKAAQLDAIQLPEGINPAEQYQDSVHVLGQLAHSHPPVRGAHPHQWWGLRPLSSTDPVVPEDQPRRISPSKVETLVKSPLNWFVQNAGGTAAHDFAASLGTLIHSIAEEHPDASGSEYQQILEQRWPELEKMDNWEGQRDFDRATLMLKKFAQYCIAMRQEGRELVARELPFEIEVPTTDGTKVQLRGIIDRVEADAQGKVTVVDLKTGSTAPSKNDTLEHPQLGVYQTAIQLGALQERDETAEYSTEPAGASLVYVGTNTKSPTIREQPSLGEEDWARTLILEAASLMGQKEFITRHLAGASGILGNCTLPEICPLCAEGRQVTER
ncbi:ATP-dependent helicase [Arthrobacter sp. NIO-1057]|uniref:ATP-dependent helicase n=1 Tax=Arthrobacter sp. NIO-1057 TaxID=993071 RepID=UPI000818392C|nr:ATP-dependent DNA helicase [Arthrobacter sp. NIO-1057]SCB95398.1 Superfamily I DNA or RNA helicase [Arthrobacter sp. NIO-1057]